MLSRVSSSLRRAGRQNSEVCDGLWAAALFCLDFLHSFLSMKKEWAQWLERSQKPLYSYRSSHRPPKVNTRATAKRKASDQFTAHQRQPAGHDSTKQSDGSHVFWQANSKGLRIEYLKVISTTGRTRENRWSALPDKSYVKSWPMAGTVSAGG